MAYISVDREEVDKILKGIVESKYSKFTDADKIRIINSLKKQGKKDLETINSLIAHATKTEALSILENLSSKAEERYKVFHDAYLVSAKGLTREYYNEKIIVDQNLFFDKGLPKVCPMYHHNKDKVIGD